MTADEFPRLMALLGFTSLPTTVAGQIEIVNMVSFFFIIFIFLNMVFIYFCYMYIFKNRSISTTLCLRSCVREFSTWTDLNTSELKSLKE